MLRALHLGVRLALPAHLARRASSLSVAASNNPPPAATTNRVGGRVRGRRREAVHDVDTQAALDTSADARAGGRTPSGRKGRAIVHSEPTPTPDARQTDEFHAWKELEWGRANMRTTLLPEKLATELERVIAREPSLDVIFKNARTLCDHLLMVPTAATLRELVSTEVEEKKKASAEDKDKRGLLSPAVESRLRTYVSAMSGRVRYGARETLAYALGRMPSVFASTDRVLAEVRKIAPDFLPRTMLDFGSGTGSAIWAAHNNFASLHSFLGVDVSQDMIDLSTQLIEQNGSSVIGGVVFARYLSATKKKYDLVVASYALSDVDSDVLPATVERLWEKTGDVLVLVEPGNQRGFQNLLLARKAIMSPQSVSAPMEESEVRMQLQQLLDGSEEDGGMPVTKSNIDAIVRQLSLEERKASAAQALNFDYEYDPAAVDAHILAPCPHNGPCPLMRDTSPCAFFQRAHLPPFANASDYRRKSGHDFRAERFSYLVIRRGQRPKEAKELVNWPRIVRHNPDGHGKAAELDLCHPTGNVSRHTVSASQGNRILREAKSRMVGDAFPFAHSSGRTESATHGGPLQGSSTTAALATASSIQSAESDRKKAEKEAKIARLKAEMLHGTSRGATLEAELATKRMPKGMWTALYPGADRDAAAIPKKDRHDAPTARGGGTKSAGVEMEDADSDRAAPTNPASDAPVATVSTASTVSTRRNGVGASAQTARPLRRE